MHSSPRLSLFQDSLQPLVRLTPLTWLQPVEIGYLPLDRRQGLDTELVREAPWGFAALGESWKPHSFQKYYHPELLPRDRAAGKNPEADIQTTVPWALGGPLLAGSAPNLRGFH